ncbi:biliverdin-producing heme oxygenase [Desertivirga arenae]|uniref:biliverdin-producing heme oxygenase n=1 Tax=Desertivirga arenae TaxID=2810309 RepID=UPI001A96C80F|nr:biliverdin-producing heme oxygenase [Pedobacter sp. SYSU D00823]
MNLSLVLKDKTDISHQQLEKLLVGKLKSIAVEADYIEILKKFYGYIKPLEERISKNLDINKVPDYPERRKSDALELDLQYFNTTSDVSLCDDLPVVTNTYEAIGALYVLEGSTLGGTIISKMVSAKLGLSASEGLSFFYSYGSETMKMWEQFKIALNTRVAEEDWNMVIIGADETFIKFRNWLE